MKRLLVAVCLLTLLTATALAQNPTMGVLDALTLRQNATAQRATSGNVDLKSNGDSVPIPAGKTLTLLDVDGPGVITHFWNTIAAYDPFYGRSVVLRIYYDGADKPSVQAPLGDFFGVGHGMSRSFTSLPVSVTADGLARTCYWRMPFRKHIKVTISNESPIYPVPSFYYNLDWLKCDSLPKNTMYFQAEYRQAMPAKPGNYTILDTTGSGQYVGTVYSVQQVELGWFGEGDDFFYIDGAKYPQLRGTGTEDYFNSAWGFREFCTPFYGVPVYEGVFPSDRVTAYRWHIFDPVPFKKSLRVTIEHRGSVDDETATDPDKVSLASSPERPDWISSVAFWYQYPPTLIDKPLPPVNKRIAPYQVIQVGKLKYHANPAETVRPAYVGIEYLIKTPTASISFNFNASKPGRYRINGLFQRAITSGIFQPYLDGKKIGQPLDMVVPGSGFHWYDFDLHDLTAGTHTLRFDLLPQQSPHKRSIPFKFTSFTFEYLTLLRLEDMQGYHQLYNEMKSRMKKKKK